jgi:hypothetical protein
MFNLNEIFGNFELIMRCGAIDAVATTMAATLSAPLQHVL